MSRQASDALKLKRECGICRDEESKNLVSITPMVYTYINGRKLQASVRVVICKNCLGKALASGNAQSPEWCHLSLAITERVRNSYNAILGASID